MSARRRGGEREIGARRKVSATHFHAFFATRRWFSAYGGVRTVVAVFATILWLHVGVWYPKRGRTGHETV
jgi:hypothetical protein